MVKIINGEIVSDNDPRVVGAQRRSSGGSRGGTQERAGYGRVASLLDPPSTSSTAGARSARGQGTGGGRGGGGGVGGGPLQQLAEMIGVGGRFIKIPGVLGVQENEVPLIYLMIAALVVLFGGWKIAALIVFAYVISNQKGRAR